MNNLKNVLIGFILAACLFLTIGATNVRLVGNSDNGRYEIYHRTGVPGGRDYLLDTQTGDMWKIDKDKKPVKLKQK